MLDTPEKLQEFYKERFAKYGNTAQGMGWMDEAVHYQRIIKARDVVALLTTIPPERVLDVGCGVGLLPIIWNLQYTKPQVKYIGMDIVEEYVAEAKSSLFNYTNAEVWQADFLIPMAVVEPSFNLTIAIGAFAWQPLEVALNMVNRMWELTNPNGVMLFTYLPDAPIPNATVRWLFQELDAKGYAELRGYAGTGEVMVAFKKGDN